MKDLSSTKRIADLHQRALQMSSEAIKAAVECGLLLNQAKKKIGHGNWEAFVKDCGLPLTTAWRYRRVADDFEKRGGDWRLLKGDNLCGLYRELGFMKPLDGGGQRLGKAELERRNAEKARQFEFNFVQTGFHEIKRWRQDNGMANPFELLESDQLTQTVDELEEALRLAKEALR